MLVYLLFFIIIYLKSCRYNSSLLKVVLLFYIVASLCAIYTHIFIAPEAYSTFTSIVFHLLVILLFLLPIINYAKREQTRKLILMKYSAFKVLAYFCIVLQLYSIAYFIPYDIKIFFSGDLGALRSALTNGEVDSFTGGGILRTIAGVASYYYCISILLFFYSIAFLEEKKSFNILLLVSSLSRVFQSFSYVGRDGIIFWIFSFVFSFYIFKPYISDDVLKKIKSLFVVFGGFALLLLTAISMSRFSGTDKGVINWLIDYLGQPLNNFGQLFDKFHEYTGNRSLWPWFYGETGARGVDAVTSTMDFFKTYGFNSNIFFTYVGSFYKAYGPIVTLMLSIVFSLIFSFKLSKHKIGMAEIILLMFTGQIVWNCYFYYMFANRVGNLFVISLFFIGMFCKIMRSKYLVIPMRQEEGNVSCQKEGFQLENNMVSIDK